MNPGWWHPLSILEKNVLIYRSRPGQVQPDYLWWDNEPLRLASPCGHCRSQIFCRPRRYLSKLLQFGIDPAVGPLPIGASEGRNLRFIMEWPVRWPHLKVEGEQLKAVLLLFWNYSNKIVFEQKQLEDDHSGSLGPPWGLQIPKIYECSFDSDRFLSP